MDAYLDPVTLKKLREFENRRKKLIRIRGICAVVITVLISMSLIAFIDLLIVLPDIARIVLSVLAYIITAVVFYITCLKWYLHKVDLYDLARMFESDKDDLKEEVLTAVELGLPRSKVYDSLEFRNMLQAKVAGLVKGYNLKSLLPLSAIKNWTITAALILTLCSILLLVPKLQFGKLIARAMAPTANISRVSGLEITIIEPLDPQIVVPRGDPVTIIAQLSEPDDHQVYIESYVDSQKPVTIQMEPTGNNQYSSTLLVARQKLTYRVYSGKASTKYFTITSWNRPYVKKFFKTYIYPKYSLIETETKEDITGDIMGLQGTTAELKIQTDQPVNKAQLWIDYPGGRKEVDLNISNPRLLLGKIELKESATYRVHLKARLTDFENKFAPTYEIQVVPDLIPSVKIEKPLEDLILPSDEIVSFLGFAQDDLGLESVKQIVRVNRKDPNEFNLSEKYEKQYDIEKNLDLLNLQLKPGDQVHTKFVAVDIKGNKGESRTIQITISSPGYSVDRVKNLQQSYNLRQLLLRLVSTSRQVKEDVKSMRDQVTINPDNTELIRQKVIAAQVSAEKVEIIASSAWNAVQSGMQKINSKEQWQDLMLIGRMISRVRHENLWQLHLSLNLSERGWRLNEKDLKAINDSANSLEWRTSQVKDAHEKMLELESIDNIIHEMNRLANNQKTMLKDAEGQLEKASLQEKEGIYRRLTRQVKSSVREQEMIEKLIGDFSGYAEYNQSRNAKNILKDLSVRRLDLEEKLEDDQISNEKLPGHLNEMASKLSGHRDNLVVKRKTSWQRVTSKRKELVRTLARTSDTLNNLKWKLDTYSSDRKRMIQLQSQANIDSNQMDQQTDKVYRSSREVELRWGSAIGQLHDRSRIEELGVDPLYLFVNDNVNTAAAVEIMEDKAKQTNTVDSLHNIAKDIEIIQKAYRLLEVGSGFEYETNLISDMHAAEKWEFSKQQNYNHSLDQWPQVIDMFKTFTEQFKQTSVPKEFRDRMYKFLKDEPIRIILNESNSRSKNSNHNNVDMTDRLQNTLITLQNLDTDLQPYMQEARDIIAQYAPSLVEQLKNAAKHSRQLEQETEEYMEQDNTDQSPEQTRLELNQLMQQQRELNSRINTVRNALRRDANIQDMSTKEGVERARDGDDSIAIIQEPPEKAENYLRNAAISSDKDTQDRAVDMANVQQEKLTEALDLIAKHYENLESGNPQETRLALREAEEMLESALAIEQDYEKVDELAALQQMTPEQLMQYLEQQLGQNEFMQEELDRIVDDTLQQSRTDLENMVSSEKNISDKLENIAAEQQPSEFAEQLKDLNNQANQLAGEAKKLADNDIEKARNQAKQADVKEADPLIEKAQDTTHKSAEQLSGNQNSNPGSMSEQMKDFSRDLDQASQDLHEAAGKTEVASNQVDEDQNKTAKASDAENATDLTRKSEQKAKELSNKAQELSNKFAELDNQQKNSQVAQMDQKYQDLQNKANELADRAQEMVSEQIPKLSSDAEKFSDNPIEGLNDAQSAAQAATEQMPREFDRSPERLAEHVEDFAQSMDQAQNALQSAARDLGKIPTKQKREGASELIQDTRQAQQQAREMQNQAKQLANDLKNLNRKRNQMMQNTPQQQQAINLQAPKVANDMARAANHAERLGLDQAQDYKQTAEEIEKIANHELPAAQESLDTASRAGMAQEPVAQAHSAMSQQLQSLDRSMQAGPAESQQSQSMESQLTEPAQAGQWMARTLDELEAANMSQQNSLQQQATQSTQQPLSSQQNQMARARNMSMTQQQNASMTRYMSSVMSNEQTSSEMPMETSLRLADRIKLRQGKWGQLRQLDSKDLFKADSEAISEEYKDMVHTYFRVIAERAKQKN